MICALSYRIRLSPQICIPASSTCDKADLLYVFTHYELMESRQDTKVLQMFWTSIKLTAWSLETFLPFTQEEEGGQGRLNTV